MKRIALRFRHEITLPGETLVNITAASEEIREAQKKGDAICRSAAALEGLIEEILNYYFKPEIKSRAMLLESAVFGSSSLSLSDKRRILFIICDAEGIISGTAYTDFQRSIKQVISLRNAFTHGKITSDGTTLILTYFEGTKKSRKITDEFLTEIEEHFNKAWHYVDEVTHDLGLYNRPEQNKGTEA